MKFGQERRCWSANQFMSRIILTKLWILMNPPPFSVDHFQNVHLKERDVTLSLTNGWGHIWTLIWVESVTPVEFFDLTQVVVSCNLVWTDANIRPKLA